MVPGKAKDTVDVFAQAGLFFDQEVFKVLDARLTCQAYLVSMFTASHFRITVGPLREVHSNLNVRSGGAGIVFVSQAGLAFRALQGKPVGRVVKDDIKFGLRAAHLDLARPGEGVFGAELLAGAKAMTGAGALGRPVCNEVFEVRGLGYAHHQLLPS